MLASVSPEVSPVLPCHGEVVLLQNIPAKPGKGQCHWGHLCLFAASLVLHKAGTTAFAQDIFLERSAKHRGSQHPQMVWDNQERLHTTRLAMDSTQESCSQVCSGPHTSQLQGGVVMGSLKARQPHHRHKKAKVSSLKKGQGLLCTIYFPKGVEREKWKRAESPEGILIKIMAGTRYWRCHDTDSYKCWHTEVLKTTLADQISLALSTRQLRSHPYCWESWPESQLRHLLLTEQIWESPEEGCQCLPPTLTKQHYHQVSSCSCPTATSCCPLHPAAQTPDRAGCVAHIQTGLLTVWTQWSQHTCPGRGQCWTIDISEAKVLCSSKDQDCRHVLPRKSQAPGNMRARDVIK